MNALKPCASARASSGSVEPSPRAPSIARRARLKSPVVGANATKCSPADGVADEAGVVNGLSSVLKSARCTIGVHILGRLHPRDVFGARVRLVGDRQPGAGHRPQLVGERNRVPPAFEILV